MGQVNDVHLAENQGQPGRQHKKQHAEDQAIQQLDNVIQQNSATSEEMASTAEELAAQAEMLQQSVAFFRILENEEEGSSEGNRRITDFHVQHVSQKKRSLEKNSSGNGHHGGIPEIAPGTLLDLAEADIQQDERDAEFERY